MDPSEKYARLLERLGALDGALVAFSGGVDSTLLLYAAREALGDRVLAVTARAPFIPAREQRESAELAGHIGVRHCYVDGASLDDVAFAVNPPDRCYHCKTALLTGLRALADAEGLPAIVEGSNADDGDDYRPGVRAVAEQGALSPLADAGLTKAEIRALSRERGLPTWSKPAAACLASRIPYGVPITAERLQRIERAEEALHALGLAQLRVRDHGDVARLELEPGDVDALADPTWRKRVTGAVRDAGFRYVAVDLDGYRTGALNEVLDGDDAGGDGS